MSAGDTIPAVARAGLADAVDAYCETIGFTAEQTQRVFAAARAHGLPVKLHADQLSDMNGARLAAEGLGAVRRSPRIHERRGRGGDGEGGHRRGPAAGRVLRAAGVAVAAGRGIPARARADGDRHRLQSGTSPTTSLPLMLNMACILFRLSAEEALAGVTVHAARALGLIDRGIIATGLRADLVCWKIAEPAELAYRIGGDTNCGVVRGGRVAQWPS
jgi:imidazolonepropionase